MGLIRRGYHYSILLVFFGKLINVGKVLYFPNMFCSVSAINYIVYGRLLDHIYDFRIKAMFGSSFLPVVCMID